MPLLRKPPFLETLSLRVLDSGSREVCSVLKHTRIHTHKFHLLSPMLRNHRPAIVRTSCDRKKRTRRIEKRGGRRKGGGRVILEAAKKVQLAGIQLQPGSQDVIPRDYVCLSFSGSGGCSLPLCLLSCLSLCSSSLINIYQNFHSLDKNGSIRWREYCML